MRVNGIGTFCKVYNIKKILAVLLCIPLITTLVAFGVAELHLVVRISEKMSQIMRVGLRLWTQPHF